MKQWIQDHFYWPGVFTPITVHIGFNGSNRDVYLFGFRVYARRFTL